MKRPLAAAVRVTGGWNLEAVLQVSPGAGCFRLMEVQMDLETFSYFEDGGWSVSPFPDWDSDRTLLIVFGAPEFRDHPEAIKELIASYPRSHVVGCSSAGEIHGSEVYDRSLSVAVARFEKTSMRRAFVTIDSAQHSFEKGAEIANALLQDDLRGVLVLSDGTHVNGTDLIRGINSVLPESVVVTGGLAGDGDRFEQTWVLQEGQPFAGGVSAIAFYGDAVRIGHGSKGGWDIFGPQRTVTRAEGNVLYELDGEPALVLYKKYLGDRASGLPATGLLFPLQVWPPDSAEESKTLVRTILAVDEAAQSMTFAGDIPEGAKVQLMKANFDRLIEGAEGAAEMIRGGEGGGANLCVAISCVGRRLVLGERTEEETEATLEVLPENTKQIGFYSYGEISPYATGRCDLHNQTMTLTTISES